LRDPTFSRFGTVSACDRQTDTETDRRTDKTTVYNALADRRVVKMKSKRNHINFNPQYNPASSQKKAYRCN